MHHARHHKPPVAFLASQRARWLFQCMKCSKQLGNNIFAGAHTSRSTELVKHIMHELFESLASGACLVRGALWEDEHRQHQHEHDTPHNPHYARQCHQAGICAHMAPHVSMCPHTITKPPLQISLMQQANAAMQLTILRP